MFKRSEAVRCVCRIGKKEVKIHRMPGWRKFKRNDVLVFNFPYPGRWDSIAFDVMSYYVKRCIAVPGDTLEIKDCHYRVKGHDGYLGNTAAQDKLQKLLDSEEFVNRGIVVESYPLIKNWAGALRNLDHCIYRLREVW